MTDIRLVTARTGPAPVDPDGIDVQRRLPLIDSPHDHTDYLGMDRHTALYVDGAGFRVCPRDCPDRSRSLVTK